jgi:putative Holliday junction resolvase
VSAAHADRPGADLPSDGRVLAIDLGAKRIGLALSDPSQTIAQPLTTLTRRMGKRFPMKQLRAAIEEHNPVGVLMGLPLTPDGTEDARADEARAVGAAVSHATGLPVAYWDERMTTARVLAAAREAGARAPDRQVRDPLAATVLLQTFLDRRRP